MNFVNNYLKEKRRELKKGKRKKKKSRKKVIIKKLTMELLDEDRHGD